MRVSRLSYVALLTLVLVIPANAGELPGEAAGRKIGTGIRAAIDAALPGVSALIEAIWPKKSADEKDKQTKAAVQAEIDKYQKSATSKLTAALASTSTVVAQLDTVNAFSKAADDATLSVQKAMLWLSSPGAITPQTWSLIDDEWNVVSAELADLEHVQIEGFDSFVTDTLQRIQQARKSVLIRVDGRRKSRDAAGMHENLSHLALLLEATRNLTTYQITQVKAAFAALVAPAGSVSLMAMAPPPANGATPSKEMEQLIARLNRLIQPAER